LAAVVVLGSLASFERYRAAHAREISRGREERLAELEQVRKRIAADLHDEIGSSLTQISILSEVALREGADASPELSRPLSTIASSSRELIDSMSDIVWAINPDKDHLLDLTQRMRRYAADAFTASNTAFQLELPAADREITLGANVRREVFLIFKEAVTNIVKHAAGSEAFVALAIEGGVLRLDVRDNGQGFDPHAPSDGHGLESLRVRAAAIGGRLTVVTAPGSGTAIALHLPIAT
jgi:signal transduction histidine kinase